MERKYTCDCDVIHDDVVHKVRSQMLDMDMYQRLALLYKMFGDETRIRLLCALEHSEMCVCDLSVLPELVQMLVHSYEPDVKVSEYQHEHSHEQAHHNHGHDHDHGHDHGDGDTRQMIIRLVCGAVLFADVGVAMLAVLNAMRVLKK